MNTEAQDSLGWQGPCSSYSLLSWWLQASSLAGHRIAELGRRIAAVAALVASAVVP